MSENFKPTPCHCSLCSPSESCCGDSEKSYSGGPLNDGSLKPLVGVPKTATQVNEEQQARYAANQFAAPVTEAREGLGLYDIIDSQRTQIFQMTEELRRWRVAAAQLALARGPVESPDLFISSQIDQILHLIESARQGKSDTAEARDLVRRLVMEPGQTPLWPEVRTRALEELGQGPQCGYCGKSFPDSDPRPRIFFTEDVAGSEKVHAECQDQAQRKAFLALSLEAREQYISQL